MTKNRIQKCNLERICFYDSNLSETHFSGSYLKNCEFDDSILDGVCFRSTKLEGFLGGATASCYGVAFEDCKFIGVSRGEVLAVFPKARFRDCAFEKRSGHPSSARATAS